MPGTTRQIFDQLQGSNGIVSQTPGKVDLVYSKWASVDTLWSQIKTAAGTNGITYLASKGLTDSFIQEITSDASVKSSIDAAKVTAQKSQKEFSPRMMTAMSYESARQHLADTDLGASVYTRMFNIHSSSLRVHFDNVSNKVDPVITNGTALKNYLTQYPIPAVVPPATTPVVNPAIDTAITAFKSVLEALRVANTNLKTQSDNAVLLDSVVMDEYLRYISNANLAKVLPEWYADPDKITTINSVASSALVNIIK